MATTRRNHLTASHDRSAFILERRRKLFPIDDYDLDSELGHISPLCSDTSDSDSEGVNLMSEYDIVGFLHDKADLGCQTPSSTKSCSETMSPLKLSPYPTSLIRTTPKKYSPSHNLKTPHDTSTKPVLQREQKTLLEESKSLKRKSSPSSSPEQNKSLKTDIKSSKVRTALFPPENDTYAPLPTKSFYSKHQEGRKLSSNRDKFVPKHIKSGSVRQSYHPRKKLGQINNGVGHKIRKPKQRKISKAVIAKAAKKLLESGSVLNDYMQDLKELRNKQNTENKLIVNYATLKDNAPIQSQEEDLKIHEDLTSINALPTAKKLISTPVKLIQTFTEENKENIQTESQLSPSSLSSPRDMKSRKFFKSSRVKVSSKPEKTKDLARKISGVKKFDLTAQGQEISDKISLQNDFEYDDMEPGANIDNILSVLSEESPQRQVVDQNEHGQPLQHFERGCEVAFDTNDDHQSKGLTLQTDVASQNRHIVNETEYAEPLQHFENSCQAVFDIPDPLNNVINRQWHGTSEMSGYNGCQSILDSSKFKADVFAASGCQGIDTKQYLQTNDDNGPNNYLTANLDTVDTVDSQPSFPQGSFDVNIQSTGNMYNSKTLEPCIVSSQVVFDNILLEDGSQAFTSASSNENGSFPTVSNGINHLETNRPPSYSNRIALEAHNSILASENSIQLHQNNVANMILSPISQMCDVTSGLALNSPKRGRNLSALLNNMSRASKILSFTTSRSADMEEQQRQKLFPVFYPGAKGVPERGEKRERGEVKRSAKKFKALHEDQMLLDAGQKKFGYTICNECNIVYHMGDPGDEIEHRNYHNASHILRFGGWKNEHIVGDFQKNGRIIKVLPTDSKIWLKKVKDLMEFVKRDLGCYEMEYDITGSQVFLYIKNRTIAGCAVATVPKEAGHRMLSPLSGVAMCSEEAYPIKCGISHIWVASNFRKQGIATALMDAVKRNFIYGYILTDHDIALTSPTEAGSAFAEKYFKTPNYLVYYT